MIDYGEPSGEGIVIDLTSDESIHSGMVDFFKASTGANENAMDYLYIPNRKELARIAELCFDLMQDKDKRRHGVQTCPKCNTGRLVLRSYGGPIGSSLILQCKWSDTDCDYREDITDYNMW